MSSLAKQQPQEGKPYSFIVLNWRPCVKNTLLGFLDLRLPSGLVIRGLTIHTKGDRRWVGLPARPYTNDAGAVTWTPVVEILDRARHERFDALVLSALDQFIGART
jgi:hypothetical protein